jgi:hypothetical protein
VSARYVTLPAGPRTVVARISRPDGKVLRSRHLRGIYTVPAVALDGSTGGLSADATALALIKPRARFPQRRTSVVVLDGTLLRVQRQLTLRGDFSFDAISPDGDLLYLVQYLSRRDPTRYAVRAYDLGNQRLLPDPIVDPREPDEQMGGFPVTRATSADGRWAYTLYDGAGKHPFIHALDTVGRTAACIDLDALTGRRDLPQMRLAVGKTLDVMDGRVPIAHVDTRTFGVEMTESGTGGQEDGASSEALPWVLVALGLVTVALTAFRMRRRRRLVTS